MPDTKNDNKGQKTTTTESKVNGESTKPTTLDDRIAQMDNKSTGAPAFSSIPSTDKKPAEAKQPEPEVKKPAPEAIPEQKTFEKLPDKPKPEPEPQPAVVAKSEPVRVMDEGEPEGKNKVLRMFVVGLIVGAILTSIFI